MLTPRQHDLLIYIDRHLQDTGRSPNFEDMKNAVKIKSMAGIYREISVLEEHGYISRQQGRARALTVLRRPEMRRVTGSAEMHRVTGSAIDGEPTSSPRPAHAPDAAPVSELPWEGDNVAGRPMWTPRGAGTDTAMPGPERTVGLSTPRALRLATSAVCQGYGLADETSRHRELVAQAIELSHLMAAYGLVPTQAEFAAGRSDTEARNSAAQEAHSAGGVLRPAGAVRHVLVVDDVPDVLVSVTAFLKTAGFLVLTATDGDTALRLIATDSRIGVLITDYVMPGMSGVDLIDQAVRLRPHLKALLITGFPQADGLAELSPHVTVLAKPFRRAALIAQVRLLEAEAAPVHLNDVQAAVMASLDDSA
jgi:CheY-like chemotaxis protein